MKYDLDILNKYKEDGLIDCQKHPIHPLFVYKYSRECQYKGIWDDITLNMRGTILDLEGNLIAKGFSKFFNYEEVIDTINWSGENVWVQEKMDGSCGILFNYNDEWIMATNGSFTSSQAIKGLEIIKSNYDLSLFDKNLTYVVEIIYKDNKIVVDYGNEEKVVFLTIFNKNRELPMNGIKNVLLSSGIPESDFVISNLVISPTNDLAMSLKNKKTNNSEGYVLRFQPSNYRIKIKFEDYVKLHRLLTSFSNIDIWESLKNNDDISKILNNIPDEFDTWVKNEILNITSNYNSLDEFSNKVFNEIGEQTLRKDFAQQVMNQDIKLRPILFRMYDNRKYDDLLWKLVKPEKSKPFRNEITD